MHFYCTTDFEEIYCSCGFRGFGQGHRHQKIPTPNGVGIFCAVGTDLMKSGSSRRWNLRGERRSRGVSRRVISQRNRSQQTQRTTTR